MEKGESKYRALTVEDKIELIRLVEKENKTQASIANSYNCGKSTISKIIKNKEKWRPENLQQRKKIKVQNILI